MNWTPKVISPEDLNIGDIIIDKYGAALEIITKVETVPQMKVVNTQSILFWKIGKRDIPRDLPAVLLSVGRAYDFSTEIVKICHTPDRENFITAVIRGRVKANIETCKKIINVIHSKITVKNWLNVIEHGLQLYESCPKPEENKQRKIKSPGLPVEVHNNEPIDGQKALDITKGMF